MNVERTYLAVDGWHTVYDDGTDVLTIAASAFDQYGNIIIDNGVTLHDGGYTQEQISTLQQMTDVQAAQENYEAHRMDWLNDTHNGAQFILSNDGVGNIPDTDFIGGRWGHWADLH